MTGYSPEVIQAMRAALDAVMTKIPPEQATQSVKAAVAEHILKVAAQGQTSSEALIAAASEHVPSGVVSTFDGRVFAIP